MSNIVPWSFSKLKAFETCPKQFYHVKILKEYPQVETEAMRYGSDVHLACEEYIRDNKPLPKKYEYVLPSLEALKRKKGEKLCEHELGLTEDLKPCGFKDKDVWFRGIADLIILDKDNKLAWVVDYKTGKSARYADKGQLELMALAVFIHFPEIEEVRGGLLFVVCKQLITETYSHCGHQSSLIDKYTNKFRQMIIASDSGVWNAKPSGLCRRHCDVVQCVHNGRN
jgi:RecB family exonuclease